MIRSTILLAVLVLVSAAYSFAQQEKAVAGSSEPADHRMTRAQLIEGFTGLPPERQLALLSEEWDLVRGPEMLPLLRSTIKHAPHESTPVVFPAMAWPGPSDLAEYALYRLRELEPDEEKAILLKDITLVKPRFADAAVRELPTQDRPEADEAIAANLASDPMTALSAAPLAAKFGTRRLMKPMLALYRGPDGPCIMDDWFVAYFIRVDAEAGARILEQAMTARKKAACFQSLLGRVAAITWNQVLQDQAITTLSDSDQEAASDAARALAARGGKDVQEALWQSLERWHEQAAHLQSSQAGGGGRQKDDGLLGYSLFRAMAEARAWVVDEPMAKRLASLCVEETCHKEWGSYKIGRVRIQNATGLYGRGRLFRIGSRAFADIAAVEEKMTQYPAGTVFEWCPQNLPAEFSVEELDRDARDIERLAITHQMRMEECRTTPNP